MHRFLLLSITVFLISCEKDPPLWEIQNLNGGNIMVFGHGGMGIFSRFPLDSRPSLEECLNSAAEGTETDLRMSADSVIFLFHGEDLGDNTGCSGKIPAMKSDEISCQYKGLGSGHSEVLRLEEFLQGNAGKKQFVLECKVGAGLDENYIAAFARELKRQVEMAGITSRCMIESTSPVFLENVKKIVPSLQVYLYSNDFDIALKSAQVKKFDGLTFDMNLISADEISRAHQAGLRVSIFNQQNQDENIRAIQMSPDNIQTDRLENLLQLLNK